MTVTAVRQASAPFVNYPVLPGEVAPVPALLGYTYGDVRRHGADPANTAAVNATAIANAAATAAALGVVLYFPPGVTYNTNGNLLINSHVMARGCTLNWSGTGDAIVFAPAYAGGGSPTLIQKANIYLPEVVNANKTVNGWAQAGVAGSVGVRVRHTYNSTIIIPYVRNFETGVLFYGEHDGSDYNEIHIGHLSNNKVDFTADATSDGWTNENNVIGGRMGHDNTEGSNVTGVRKVLIKGASNYPASNTDVLNNWRFWGTSFEGDVPEYHVENRGMSNRFYACRWEATSPKFLNTGAQTSDVEVLGGYGASTIAFTLANSAAPVNLRSRDTNITVGASSGPTQVFQNNNSSASPMLVGYPAGANPHTAVAATAYAFFLSSQKLLGKLTGDAAPRVQIDFTTGAVLVGDGTGTPKAGLNGLALQRGVRTLSVDSAIGSTDGVILGDATSSLRQFGLPAASAAPGQLLTVIKIDSSANGVLLNRNGTDTINGATSYNLGGAQYAKVTLLSDGVSKWYVIG